MNRSKQNRLRSIGTTYLPRLGAFVAEIFSGDRLAFLHSVWSLSFSLLSWQ